MVNRRHNNYNPYTFGYQAPLESASISYNPTFDPAEHQMLVESLAKSQQRYDVGREALSEFEGQVGGMQTYAPDALNQRLESFNQKALDLVNNQYGRDYGLAYNDLKGLISKEKSDPFYKLNAAQVRAADEERQFRMKNPDAFYTYKDRPSISSEEYLMQAYKDKNMAAFDEPTYGYAPDRPDIAAKIATAYWQEMKPKIKDFSDTKKVTKLINGGYNGLSDREKKCDDSVTCTLSIKSFYQK